ncbi:hypothetical protein HHK36_024084 [Tetracentron sinense]|uniref:Uncharacterized protein n=1 Tax=Tetracentron sinense TaxID=13715 RepID=A0A835D3T7_TETSI|nr:hypothetical protein HHK36_024084 [Tetracentron sinense]
MYSINAFDNIFVVNLIIDITFFMKRANHPDGLEPDRLHIFGVFHMRRDGTFVDHISEMLHTDAPVVLDFVGRDLQSRTRYYVYPIIDHVIRRESMGGGLSLSSRNDSCPLYVVQERDEYSIGLPLMFLPVNNSSDGVIRESSDLNIVFLWDTSCQNSTTVWSLGTFDEITRWQYIVTGGVIGNPGPSTVNNWFKIERYLEDYKLVFCPEVCCSCKVTCGDVGVFYEDRTQWLGLSDVPLPVMFEKPLT